MTSAAALALSVSSLSAFADSGEIHFNGKILEKTCTVAVNGVVTPAVAPVTLPETNASELQTAGQTAGETPFIINLQDCMTQSAAAEVLFGSAVLDGDQLGNTAAQDAALNVALELTEEGGSPVDLKGSVPTYIGLSSGQGSAIYKVRYYAKGSATPGAVEATALYTIRYP